MCCNLAWLHQPCEDTFNLYGHKITSFLYSMVNLCISNVGVGHEFARCRGFSCRHKFPREGVSFEAMIMYSLL